MAGRYANALFELARDENKLEETEAALTGLSASLDESEDLRRLVRSPIFSAAEQSGALAGIASKASLPTLTANFLQLLARNRRLFALRNIIAGFRKLSAEHRGEVTAYVTSAVAFRADQRNELKATLKAKTGKNITLIESVDPAVLGGLVVTVGSRMIDSSIRTKLNTLKYAMKEVG